MTNITILGSGFGALTTVRELRKRHVDAEITLISPQADLQYLPSSIWVHAKLRNPADLRIPLSKFFARHNVTFVQAAVTGLEDGGRTVLTNHGVYRNDYLVIATGGRFIKKLPGIEHALTPCEGISIAEELDRRLETMDGGTLAFGFASNPNEPTAMRGGPMFEFLFITDSYLRRTGRRDKFKLVFFSPAPKPGIRLGEGAVAKILEDMKTRGIETHLGHKMVRIEENKVVTEGGEFHADLVAFMPGMTGPAWLTGAPDLPLSPGGMIAADKTCAVAGHSNVWVVGDAGSFPGPDWLAKQAHQADLQAEAVAANIAAKLVGDAPNHAFKPELICIIDTLDKGILVFRDEKRSFVLPGHKIFHWLKRYFERHYLRAYR